MGEGGRAGELNQWGGGGLTEKILNGVRFKELHPFS